VWVALSFGGGQVVQMVSMLALVRLLTPKEFGVVALGLTLVFVLAHLQESGLGSALIHFREDPHSLAPSVLVFSALSGTGMCILVAAGAPLYTHLVHSPESTGVVRALSLVLLMRGLSVVPTSLLERDLDFRTRTKAELTGAIVQGGLSVGCAAGGLGAWSLVAGQLGGTGSQLALMWLLVPHRPSPRAASWAVVRRMVRYGRYVSGANIVNFLNSSVDNFAVARTLGTGPLGFYALAWRLAELPNTVIGVVLGRVMFSVYARVQEDLAEVRRVYLANLQRTLLLALPVTIGLGVAAKPVVDVLLGERWEPAVTPLRILAVFGLVRLISAPSGDLLRGIGKPHLGLIGALTFFVLAVAGLAVLVPRHGTTGAAVAMLVAIVVTDVFQLGLTLRAVRMPVGAFLAALVRPVLASAPLAATAVAVVLAGDGLDPAVELVLVVVLGAAAYLAGVAAAARTVVAPIWSALRRA
jgi:PST family polysaccharide transporter